MVELKGPAARAAIFAAAAACWPAAALAQNGIKTRIPVLWEETPCLEDVDRSIDPVYTFTYAIAQEDPAPGEALFDDEVADSRRHQFFALCRQRNPQEWPESWITQVDVDAALAKGLINETTVGPHDIMETSPLWAGCWFRITPDDARRPITFEHASSGVQWDTRTVQAGVYALWGYTWEPAFNLWSPRSGGVVRVHDGGDPAASGPAGAITSSEAIVFADESVTIEGCADGLEGTTLTGYYASTRDAADPGWAPPWTPFTEAVEHETGRFSLVFEPSAELAGHTMLIRVDITDPMQRTYEAHMLELVSVLTGSAADDCTDGGNSFVATPDCEGESSDGSSTDPASGVSGGGGDSGSASSSASGGQSSAADHGGAASGGCAVPTRRDPSPPTAWLLAGLGLWGWRRLSPRTGPRTAAP